MEEEREHILGYAKLIFGPVYGEFSVKHWANSRPWTPKEKKHMGKMSTAIWGESMGVAQKRARENEQKAMRQCK